MATVTQNVREVALFVEREPRSVWVFSPTRETAQLNDYAKVGPLAIQREVAQLNDVASEKVLPRLREVAQVSNAMYPSVRRTRLLREVAQLKSRARTGVRLTDVLRDVAELNDSVDFDIALSLRDTALLDDAATPKAFARSNLREVARLRSRHVTPITSVVREVAQLNDAASPRIRARQNARDTALLDDLILSRTVYRAVLRDTALLNDLISAANRGGGGEDVRDVAYLADNPVPPPYGRAYTCSIVTWGMSTLSNFKFTTMAGNFAAGNNLWRLDANDDYGAPISSHILTGVVDMGAGQAKRLTAVYVAGKSDAPLTVSVVADVDGQKETYDYELELRDQDDYRNNRALVGKGFRSRFAQFKIGGTAVKYRLLAAEADVSVTTRRL